MQGFPTNPKGQTPWYNRATEDFNSVLEATPTGTASTVFTANSRTTHRMNAEKEFEKTNHAETNMDVPIGLKCMWTATVIKMKEINRDNSRVFAHEPDDTPHPRSKCHS